jgi:hypothetical protein
MSQFCISCGAPDTGAAFCTSCGTKQIAISDAPTASIQIQPNPVADTIPATQMDQTAQKGDNKFSTKKKILAATSIIALTTGGGAGGFFAGKASIDLKKERSVAYDSGYEQGNANGYTNGQETGYNQGFKEGKTAGCDAAYNFYDGKWDYIVPYDTYFNRMTGGYYNSRIDCD